MEVTEMAGRSSEDQGGSHTKATHSEGSGGGRLGQSWAETELTRVGQLLSLFQEHQEGRRDHRQREDRHVADNDVTSNSRQDATYHPTNREKT